MFTWILRRVFVPPTHAVLVKPRVQARPKEKQQPRPKPQLLQFRG